MSAIRPITQLVRSSTRSFSVAARRMAEGETRGVAGQQNAFNKREKASEDLYVREEEKKKLEALKKKIADQEAQTAKDREELENLNKKQ